MHKNLLTTSFALLGLLSLAFSARAQAILPFDLHWRQATLVSVSGDTVWGTANLTLPNDVVHISNPDGTSATFNASEIRSLNVREPYNSVPFRKSGELLSDQRTYGQYNWNRDNDYGTHNAPALFVIVVPGKHALLLREYKEQIPTGGGSVATFAASQALKEAQNGGVINNTIERFYLSTEGKEVKWLRQPKKDLLAYFPDKEKQLKKFAADNNLNFNRIGDLARIVAYINML